jgi:hypothetical protein
LVGREGHAIWVVEGRSRARPVRKQRLQSRYLRAYSQRQ